jgi:hypothetical protein
MSLPDSYTLKPNAVPAYFDAVLDAQPPERFSLKFLENLGFTSTNDRLFIGILKDLGFLNRDGAPQERYFEFLDRTRARQVLADGVRESYSDLFAINKNAESMSLDDVKNKLRTLYAGKKTDLVIGNIAKTFRALCDYADFSVSRVATKKEPSKAPAAPSAVETASPKEVAELVTDLKGKLQVAGLQYHINIVLPDSRDQAVYDAIFKSLREHLG